MRTLEEVKAERRLGKTLAELIEAIFNSEKLLEEYQDPFQVFGQAGIVLSQGREFEWLDMTTDYWCHLTAEKQIQFAKAYQVWYGNQCKLPLEKGDGRKSLPMRLIPPGAFLMSSSENETYTNALRHKVHFPNAFWCGKYPVTQEIWERVMNGNPSLSKGKQNPVEQVSWEQCQDFCTKTKTALLTEAQWEYACRGGTTTLYNLGNTESDLKKAGWYLGNSRSRIHPVGKKKPNSWGLYDMHGNVLEWCQDSYQNRYDVNASDGFKAVELGSSSPRVFRGGSWFSSAVWCRSADRDGNHPLSSRHYISFRVCSPL